MTATDRTITDQELGNQFMISVFEDAEYEKPIIHKRWRYKDMPRIGDNIAYETEHGSIVAKVTDVYWFLGDEQDWMKWYSFSARIFAVQTKTNI